MYFIILFIGPDHVTSTPTNGSAMLLSCASRLYHVTIILHCHWREFWSRDTEVYLTYKHFGIILTQLYVNFSRQLHQKDDLWVSLLTPEILRFQPIPLFIPLTIIIYNNA